MQYHLFIDDESIEEKVGLKRTFHPVTKHSDNPIFVAARAWEGPVTPSTVIFDEEEGIFKMWYTTFAQVPAALGTFVACYATSTDGIHWERPEVNSFEYEGSTRNNLCAVDLGRMRVIKDSHETDLSRRYKMLYWGTGTQPREGAHEGWMGATGGVWGICIAFSPDGMHWTPHLDNPVLTRTGDAPALYDWDDRYSKYIAHLRVGRHFRPEERPNLPRRVIGRSESDDFVNWTNPVAVIVPDADDHPQAEFYYMNVNWYHGHYIGMLHLFVPSPDPFGPFWTELASSRDDIRWRRLGDRQPFLSLGEPGSWDAGMVETAKGMLEVGDELWMYYGGWHEDHGTSRRHRQLKTDRKAQQQAAAIGLVRLRRDGFISLDAHDSEGILLSKSVICGGQELVINARTADGYVAAELLDDAGRPIDGFTRADCDAFTGDSVRHLVTWRGVAAFERLNGAKVKVRFALKNAELYAFAI